MAYDCQIVDGHLRVNAVKKPYQAIDDAMAWLEDGRIATVAGDDMPEFRRRFEVRAMLSDPEYAVPGEIQRRVEAWPEKTDRRIDSLEARVRHLEELVHRLVNADPDRRWEGAVQTVELNNPYGIAAFTPVSDADWKRLDEVVQAALGHGIDRYSAACMVHAWDACAASIRELATEGDAQDAMG